MTADGAPASLPASAAGDADEAADAWGLAKPCDAVGCCDAGCSEPGSVPGGTTVASVGAPWNDEPALDACVRADGAAVSTEVVMINATNPVNPATKRGQIGRVSGA